MRERGQRLLSIGNAQTVVSAIDGIAVTVGVIYLVDDLSPLFRPQTEAFDGDTVDEEEIIADEADRWSFGAVGQASGEVPADYDISKLPILPVKSTEILE